MRISGGRVGKTVVLAVATLALGVGTASGAFPNDPPDDPDYAAAEGNPLACLTTSVEAEQHHLYDFMPACTPLATDPEGAAGMSVAKAWRSFGTGSPDTTVAYIEGGINWHADDVADFANQVFLNAGELPAPTTPDGDASTLSASDYADTPDANGNGLVDPEDIIVRFSDHVDDDHNGYVDDISGWDFYDDQNDPGTIDSAYTHANRHTRQIAAEADNGVLGAGICPRCRIVPIKAGAESLDRTDDLAEAWLYAADIGADVIASVTADLGYSSFMRQTVDKLWRQGILMVESSNDFDSTDHQGSMWWPHVLPGNALVSNAHGVPGPLANPLTTTYRARSSITSFGPKNVFSVSTEVGSTSQATPTLAGVLALVVDYGKRAAKAGLIDHPLTNSEAIQVLRATVSDIDGTPNPGGWTGKPGWDPQYGYGRPNVFKALQAVDRGEVPPEAWIDSPDWYSRFDPTETDRVAVAGHVAAPRASGYHWTLEYAPGDEPVDDDFRTAAQGDGTAAKDGRLGDLDLSTVPESFWSKAFAQSQTKELETVEQYTVTIRLRVKDAAGRTGEERRTIAVHHDPTLVPGFPKEIGAGGESQPQLADLQGRGHAAIVFGDSDGRVHALDGKSGEELPGWPVRTDATQVTKAHDGIEPGHEPIFANVAVGDLDHTGALSVVATSTTGRTYAWNADGTRRAGWPKTLDVGVVKPDIPRPAQPYTRAAHQGAIASPTLVDLDGDGELDVVQPAWDGHLHAWHADGREVAGWPVDVPEPTGDAPIDAKQLVRDHKLISSPAVADLDGDGRPELVVRSQFTYTSGPEFQLGGYGVLYAYHADGTPVDGWPVRMHGIAEYYGSAQEFILEGSDAPSAADVDGDGKDEIAASPILAPTYLYNGNGTLRTIYGPLPDATLGLLSGRVGLDTVLGQLQGGTLPTDAPVSVAASGAFGKVGSSDRLAFAQPGSGAVSVVTSLLLPGAGSAIRNYVRAYDGQTGAGKAGFPREIQGLDFMGGPAIADVSGDGEPDVVVGADSAAVHAFDDRGHELDGFPKFTGGWTVWSPTVGDLDGDGRNELVATTREGNLFAWRTEGRADANGEWWSFRHDERNSGRYGVDARPPGVVREAAVSDGGATLRFVAPGDDWYQGTAKGYRVTLPGGRLVERPATAAAGAEETLRLPAADGLCVQAIDDAGNLGTPVALGTRPPCRPGDAPDDGDPVNPPASPDPDPPADPSGPAVPAAPAGGADGAATANGPDVPSSPSPAPKTVAKAPAAKRPVAKKPAAPRLTLGVRRVAGRGLALTVGGRDRARIRSAAFAVAGRTLARDARAPFTLTVPARRQGTGRTVRLVVRVTLRDGRTATLTKAVRRR